ncbi:MAG TPA: OmpA family protein [Longimicrobium sp.]|nr:OmpA family protein [Longimicrobium sp.]
MRGRFVGVVLVMACFAVSGCGKKRAVANLGPQAETVPGAVAPGPGAGDQGINRAGDEDEDGEGWTTLELSTARATLERRVFFGFDQYDLDSDAMRIVGEKAEVLRARPRIRLRVTGHADEQGTTEYNLALGMRRATAVREALEGYGLDGRRFELASMGEEEPLVDGSTEAAHARNRRAEFTVVSGLPREPRP